MSEEPASRPVTIELADLELIYHALREAGLVLRDFYSGGNHAERKGVRLTLEELDEAEEKCLRVFRPGLFTDAPAQAPDTPMRHAEALGAKLDGEAPSAPERVVVDLGPALRGGVDDERAARFREAVEHAKVSVEAVALALRVDEEKVQSWLDGKDPISDSLFDMLDDTVEMAKRKQEQLDARDED